VSSSIGGEGQTIEFQVRDGRSTDSDLLIHFPFRPDEWWSNPYNPCGCILFFSADSQIDPWCARHGLPRGETIDIATGVALAKEWFGDYMALTWKRKSRDEARQKDLLLAYALDATAAQVEERCRQIRNILPESVHDVRRVWERRSLSVWRSEATNTLRISVELPIEEGELIIKALDYAVAAGEVATGIEPDAIAESKGTAWRAQQADALVAVAKAYLDGGGAEGTGATADHYQVVVHVDEKALSGGPGRADLPLDTVKRLLCDGSLVTLVEDERGSPLDIGRKQRTVSTALKRALYSRDRRCTFPGCQRQRYLAAHHLHHWVNGGETSAENLALICTYHHRLLHEGAFKVQREADGQLRFQRADGRTIPRGGYRLDDFTDDEGTDNRSGEGFRTAVVQHTSTRRCASRERCIAS
jgi:hypothetical protein